MVHNKSLRKKMKKYKKRKTNTRRKQKYLGGIEPSDVPLTPASVQVVATPNTNPIYEQRLAEQRLAEQRLASTPQILRDNGYILEKELGRGGFGSVSRYDKGGNKYAIKEIKYTDPATRRHREYFVRNEIAILESLKQTCEKYILCYVEDFEDPDNNTHYIVMELLGGDYISLSDYIPILHKHRRYQYERFIIIINHLCVGLKLLHTQQIAHRDIKPENIMINTKNHQIKYIDFGFAYKKDTSAYDPAYVPTMCGTPDYTDPTLCGKSASANPETREFANLKKTDLFSLGMTIYMLLSNEITPCEHCKAELHNQCNTREDIYYFNHLSLPEIIRSSKKKESSLVFLMNTTCAEFNKISNLNDALFTMFNHTLREKGKIGTYYFGRISVLLGPKRERKIDEIEL